MLNEDNDPVPFANIYITELSTGTSTDGNGKYYLNATPGNYKMVISSIGYRNKTVNITIKDVTITKNIYLESSSTELDEIVIKSKRKDPAYEIIQHAIDNRKNFLRNLTSYKTHVYVKAIEDTKETERKKKRKKVVTLEGEGRPLDPFEAEKLKEQKELAGLNMVEMQLDLNYQYPDLFKEERTAYKAYGNQSGLYIPRFSEVDFNFYKNLVELKGIAEAPVISPISRTAIIAYKYKLKDIFIEKRKTVYKIEVIPRKSSNSTVKGHIYINDSIWNINRLDLELNKGSLKFYDKFNLKQIYTQINDSLWLYQRQEFNYKTKDNKYRSFEGQTILTYSDFQNYFQFPEKFFGNEVAITTVEAYKRDSGYWHSTRPEPLTIKQQKMIHYRDSIEAYHKSQKYLDSIDTKFNKITLGEVLFHGVGMRNTSKKKHVFLGSLSNLIEFEVVGGWRLGPYASYFRRWENGKMFSTFGGFSIGLKNGDFVGNISNWYRYNPYKLGDLRIRGGRSFHSINNFDAYLNQLRISNFILHDNVHVSNKIELFNGFYIETGINWNDRKSVDGLDTDTFLNEIVDETDPLKFEDYQAVITDLTFSYTPKQKYMSEPNRKVVLGSDYPTLGFTYRKGWNRFLSSDIDFDYLQFSLEQDLLFGVLGNSKYKVQLGRFTNSKDLRLVDIKRFRESDPYLYSDPLNSFQLLDTSLVATNWFIEAHHIHHFNGALINNIPLIKKLKIRVVGGIGAMWIKESNYRYEEIFLGLERVFKLGARRRLRLGIYGAAAESNKTGATSNFKISFDIIDVWKKDWSF